MSVVDPRIARGVELLDEQRPCWHNEIDLGDFDITDTCLCVLGQLYGRFSIGVGVLGLYDSGKSMKFGFDVLDGVDLDGEVYRENALELEGLWYALIEERQAASA